MNSFEGKIGLFCDFWKKSGEKSEILEKSGNFLPGKSGNPEIDSFHCARFLVIKREE